MTGRYKLIAVVAAAGGCLAGAVWATSPQSTDNRWLPQGEMYLPTASAPGDELADHLGGVDHVPSKADLDSLLGDQAASNLISLARADSLDVDSGLRLRAYRALAFYPGPVTELALTQAISEHAEVDFGMDVPYLRAAMRAYAIVAGQDGVKILAGMLEHPSKDARAAAADAIAITRSADGLEYLAGRLGVETDPQVQRSISDAIRILNEAQ